MNTKMSLLIVRMLYSFFAWGWANGVVGSKSNGMCHRKIFGPTQFYYGSSQNPLLPTI